MKRIIAVIMILIAMGSECYGQAKKTPVKKKPTVSRAKAVPVKQQTPAKKEPPANVEIRKYFNDRNWAKTIELADERLRTFPNDQPPLIMRILAYGMVRNKQMAVKSVKALYNSNDTAAIFLATLPMHLTKDIMKADYAWYIEEAHKMSPKSASIYLMEASYYVDDSMFDKARAAALAGHALITDKERPKIEGQFASVLLATGAPDKAYEIIRRLDKTYPNDTGVVMQYYSMLVADKKNEEALVQLNRLFQLKPADSMELRKELAFLYSDLGRKDDACREASRLASTDVAYEHLLQNLQCASAYTDISPASVMKYVYEVDYGGRQYQFAVSPNKVNMRESISFSWAMSLSAEMKGTVTITKAALDTAHGQMNEFTKGDKVLDNLTTVWVSNAVYKALKEKGQTIIAASREGAKVFKVVNDANSSPAEVRLANGRPKLIHTIHVQSEDGKEDIWINDDPANPLITNMSIGWTIRLHHIE